MLFYSDLLFVVLTKTWVTLVQFPNFHTFRNLSFTSLPDVMSPRHSSFHIFLLLAQTVTLSPVASLLQNLQHTGIHFFLLYLHSKAMTRCLAESHDP